MVRQNSRTLVGHLTTLLKVLDRILALEAEVSSLRHHVSVLSKRLYRLDSPQVKISRAVSTHSPAIEKVNLRSESRGKAVEKEGVAEEKPSKVNKKGEVALGVAQDVAVALRENSASSMMASVAELGGRV